MHRNVTWICHDKICKKKHIYFHRHSNKKSLNNLKINGDLKRFGDIGKNKEPAEGRWTIRLALKNGIAGMNINDTGSTKNFQKT